MMHTSIVTRRGPGEVLQGFQLCATCAQVLKAASTAGQSARTRTQPFSTRPTAPARPSLSSSSHDQSPSRRRALAEPAQTIPNILRHNPRWFSQSASSSYPAAAAAAAATTTTTTTTQPAEPADPGHPRQQGGGVGNNGPHKTDESTSHRNPQTRADQLDYYALFPQTLPSGPPPAGPFSIDLRALRREFLQLQASVHPDFHHHAATATAPPPPQSSSSPRAGGAGGSNPRARHSTARRQAEAASAHINAAYRTLSSPLQRAQYLLHRQHGLDLAGDEAASLARPDAALLAQVLSVREAIEEAGDDEAELEVIREENEGRIRDCEAALEAVFAGADAGADAGAASASASASASPGGGGGGGGDRQTATGDDVKVKEAVEGTVRLKYWLNVRETIDNWERGGGVRPLQH